MNLVMRFELNSWRLGREGALKFHNTATNIVPYRG